MVGGGCVELDAKFGIVLNVSSEEASCVRVHESLLHFTVGSGTKFLLESVAKPFVFVECNKITFARSKIVSRALRGQCKIILFSLL